MEVPFSFHVRARMQLTLRLALALAILTINLIQPLLANVPINTIKMEKFNTQLTGTQYQFREWLFAKKPYQQKQMLLASTSKKIPYPYPKANSVHWAQITMSDTDFQTLLNRPIDVSKINFRVTAEPTSYNYQPKGSFWVDFADAEKFGGGFRGNGNLEEERMFFEFPQLAQLAFAKQASPPLPVKTSSGTFPTSADAQPFIIFNTFRHFDVSQVPYGYELEKVQPASTINHLVKELPSPYAEVNIIGIASLNWCQKNPPITSKKYTDSNLLYLLKESLLSNLGAIMSLIQFSPTHTAASIHSGQWGSGAFGNSLYTVTALQILSGMMSQIHNHNHQYGIHLHLHGVSQTIINEVENIVKTELKKPGGSPAKLIKLILNLQNSDFKKWGPKKDCKKI